MIRCLSEAPLDFDIERELFSISGSPLREGERFSSLEKLSARVKTRCTLSLASMSQPPNTMFSPAASEEKAPATRSRQRPGSACEECRRKKLRCDRKKPCGGCVDSGVVCHVNAARPERGPKKGHLKVLRSRIGICTQTQTFSMHTHIYIYLYTVTGYWEPELTSKFCSGTGAPNK